MISPRSTLALASLSLFCTLSLPVLASSNTLSDARAHLAAQNADAAWELLAPLEAQLAGKPEFDYLLGRAALATQRNTRAAMAFERCLAVAPFHGDCRLALAQTHLRLQENTQATQELTYLQSTALPPAVAEVVDEYLGLLEERGRRSDAKRLHAWAGLNVGYDDNLNAAPTQSRLDVSWHRLPITLISRKDESGFAKINAGFSYQVPIHQRWHFIGGGQANSTHNFHADDNSYFDRTLQLNSYGGVRAYFGQQRLDMVLQGQNYQLSGDTYRNLYGALVQHHYLLTPTTQLSGFVQYSQLRYELDDSAKESDVNSYTLGAQVANTQFDNQLVLHGGLHLGSDRKIRSQASNSINNDFYGVRSGATWVWSDAFKTGINLLAEQRRYKGPTTFGEDHKDREDNLISTNLEASYKITKDVTFNAQYGYTHNHSNAAVRKYKRQQASMGVRYDFF